MYRSTLNTCKLDCFSYKPEFDCNNKCFRLLHYINGNRRKITSSLPFFFIIAYFCRPSKRKLVESKGIPQESVAPRKIKRVQDIAGALSVQEAEALAMQLLGKR